MNADSATGSQGGNPHFNLIHIHQLGQPRPNRCIRSSRSQLLHSTFHEKTSTYFEMRTYTSTKYIVSKTTSDNYQKKDILK